MNDVEEHDKLIENFPLIEHLNKVAPEYRDFFISPDGELSCLSPFIFTWAILSDLDQYGYARRWCYGSLAEARAAQKDWMETGAEEPTGYIRKTH